MSISSYASSYPSLCLHCTWPYKLMAWLSHPPHPPTTQSWERVTLFAFDDGKYILCKFFPKRLPQLCRDGGWGDVQGSFSVRRGLLPFRRSYLLGATKKSKSKESTNQKKKYEKRHLPPERVPCTSPHSSLVGLCAQ